MKKFRKNPLEPDEYLRHYGNYADHACKGIFHGDPSIFSKIIALQSTGYICRDCDSFYGYCKCEGSRQHKFDSTGSVILGSCEQCKQNYCICDYDIWKKSLKPDPEKIRIFIFTDMVKRADKDVIFYILKCLYIKLLNTFNYPYFNEIERKSKFLKKIYNILYHLNATMEKVDIYFASKKPNRIIYVDEFLRQLYST